MNITSLTYIYAVTQPTVSLAKALTTLRGIAGASLRLLPPTPEETSPDVGEAQLVFVAADVPEHDFNETALKAHFEDLDWLEGVARTHHDIVQAVAAHATVLPLRLATVYQDDHSARQALALGRPAFTESMNQLRDHTEYGVKIYLAAPTDPDLAPPPQNPAHQPPPGQGLPPGAPNPAPRPRSRPPASPARSRNHRSHRSPPHHPARAPRSPTRRPHRTRGERPE